jgi:sulfoxide reductase heme-binding subunit YedZ
MATMQPPNKEKTYSPLQVIISILASFFVVGLVLVGTVVAMTPAGNTLITFMKSLFATDSIQIWWYVTRAAGIMAYLMLWLSTVLGLAVTSKYLDEMLDRIFTYDFHEFISLLAVGFLVLHVSVLMLDRYLPYTLSQVLVPFLSPYRPFWVGIGVIAFYLTLLVTITFYLRNKIGSKGFRVIHYFSLAAYIGATLHGYFSGTDTALPTMQLLYKLTGLVVLFLTVYWLVLLSFRKVDKRRKAEAATMSMSKPQNLINR